MSFLDFSKSLRRFQPMFTDAKLTIKTIPIVPGDVCMSNIDGSGIMSFLVSVRFDRTLNPKDANAQITTPTSNAILPVINFPIKKPKTPDIKKLSNTRFNLHAEISYRHHYRQRIHLQQSCLGYVWPIWLLLLTQTDCNKTQRRSL
jgi:hypothetical protein